MAVKKIYVGSFGPALYDDTDLISDEDGDFSGETYGGLKTDGDVLFNSAAVSEIKLIPKTSSSGPEGTVYYDSDDDHLYVATE